MSMGYDMVRFRAHVAGCIIVDVSVVRYITVRVIQLDNGVKCIGLLHRFYSTLLE